jgi:hypothetical protein
VHEDVFAGIATERLKGYAVWEPILRTDDARSARKSSTILPDPRVRHYWIDSQAVGEMFQAPLGLEDEPAWDVYLVYGPGLEWKGSGPPKPTYFMHQLRGLPSARRLNGETLATKLRMLLSKSTVAGTP